MSVAEIVSIGSRADGAKIDRAESDSLTKRIHAAALYIRAARDKNGILEQIVRSPILLKNNYNVLYYGRYRQS